MDSQNITIEDGKREINNYLSCIMGYLETGKIKLKPAQYMQTYTCIVRLSDEYDKASDLYVIYQHILNEYITNKVYPAI